MMDRIILQDRKDPDTFKPIVAIGHSKDLSDLETIDSFLSFLREKKIPVVSLQMAFDKAGKPAELSHAIQ